MLLVRPDHIGDVLLTAPAVAEVRASLPRAHLTYLVGPWSAEAARRSGGVDDIRTLAFPGFTRRPNATLLTPYAMLLRAAADLRRERFDAAIVFRPDHWWGALLALTAGIPVRVGGETPETAPLLTHGYRSQPLYAEPAAEHALGIARLALSALGATCAPLGHVTQFELDDAARQGAAELWRQHDLEDRRVVGLHPSAGASLKSWPVDRWARLGDALLGERCAVVLTGSPDDADLLERIAGRMAAVVPRLCGQSLAVSAAIYARCAIVVSVDSGAGHLAAAVGARTVRLYGPAPPAVFGPWPPRDGQQVLLAQGLGCVPCGHLESPPCGARTIPACMLALGVADVLNAVRSQLSQG